MPRKKKQSEETIEKPIEEIKVETPKKKQPLTKEYVLKVPKKVKGVVVSKIKLTKEGADFFRSKNWI